MAFPPGQGKEGVMESGQPQVEDESGCRCTGLEVLVGYFKRCQLL